MPFTLCEGALAGANGRIGAAKGEDATIIAYNFVCIGIGQVDALKRGGECLVGDLDRHDVGAHGVRRSIAIAGDDGGDDGIVLGIGLRQAAGIDELDPAEG